MAIIENSRGGTIWIESESDTTYRVVVCTEDSSVGMRFGPFTLADAATLKDLFVKAPIIEEVE